jgi:hypothetical protein
MSLLVLIAGGAIAALAIRFAVGDNVFNVQQIVDNVTQANPEVFKNASFGILLGMGVIAFATGFFGFFFTCCKSKCYAVIYGLILGFTWIIVVTIGALITAVSYGSTS